MQTHQDLMHKALDRVFSQAESTGVLTNIKSVTIRPQHDHKGRPVAIATARISMVIVTTAELDTVVADRMVAEDHDNGRL